LSILTGNALTAADYLIIPMNPSLYSMQGTNDLMNSVSKVKKNFNPSLSLLGVVINAFDSVPSITRQIRDEILLGFGDKVFQTILPKSIKIEEAIASKSGVTARKSLIADQVRALGEEVLDRLNIEVGG